MGTSDARQTVGGIPHGSQGLKTFCSDFLRRFFGGGERRGGGEIRMCLSPSSGGKVIKRVPFGPSGEMLAWYPESVVCIRGVPFFQ